MLKDQFPRTRKPIPHPSPPGKKKTIKKDRKNKKKLISKYITVKV